MGPYLTLMTLRAPQRSHDLREVLNALRWIVRAGAAWRQLGFVTGKGTTLEAKTYTYRAVDDVLGRQVALLHDGQVEPGEVQRFTFNGVGLSSGTYGLRARGETFQESRGLVLTK